jgi:hypothetical protein
MKNIIKNTKTCNKKYEYNQRLMKLDYFFTNALTHLEKSNYNANFRTTKLVKTFII